MHACVCTREVDIKPSVLMQEWIRYVWVYEYVCSCAIYVCIINMGMYACLCVYTWSGYQAISFDARMDPVCMCMWIWYVYVNESGIYVCTWIWYVYVNETGMYAYMNLPVDICSCAIYVCIINMGMYACMLVWIHVKLISSSPFLAQEWVPHAYIHESELRMQVLQT